MQAQSQTGFEHIKVVSQDRLPSLHPKPQKSTSPFFTKTSFQQDVDAALSSGNNSFTYPSTDCLASHASGATFASKARAAELQAARARRELKERSAQSSAIDDMPKRSRSKLTWKKVNLSELPSPEPLPQTASHENISPQRVSQNAWNIPLTSRLSSTDDEIGSTPISSEPKSDVITHYGDFPTPPDFRTPRRTRWVRSMTESDILANPPSIRSEGSTTASRVGEILQPGSAEREEKASENNIIQVATDCLPPDFSLFDSKHLNYGQVPMESLTLQADQQTIDHCSLPPLMANSNSASIGVGPHIAAPSSYLTVDSRPSVPQLRAKPPTFYPAVKGTHAGISRHGTERSYDILPPPGFSLPGSSESSRRPSEVDPRFGTVPSLISQIDGTTSRLASQVPSRHNSAFVSEDGSFGVPYRHGSALVGEDDTVVWRNRRAPVVPSTIEDNEAALYGYRKNADGTIEVDPHLKPDPKLRYRSLDPLHDSTSLTNTVLESNIRTAQQIARSQLANSRQREQTEREALRAANFSDEPPPEALETTPEDDANENAIELLLPALMQLSSYRPGSRHFTQDAFYRMGPAPEWAIDHGPDGDNSFFGGDWGTPPARVGRDPRYRSIFETERGRKLERPPSRWEGKWFH